MATPRLNGQPSQTADIPTLCQQYVGVVPEFVKEYNRREVRLLERVQGRIDANNAPDFMVKRYAHQMSESRFPPPLFTKDNIPVDGNTRVKAYAERETVYIEAWVLPIAWDDADEATKRKLKLLSLALNAMNGLALDPEELAGFARELIKDGVSDEEIVGKTGLASSKIAALRAQEVATKRLTHLGIEVKSLNLPETTLRAFGKPSAMKLDDANYSGLVDLAKDAQLKGNQVNQIATSLNGATSTELRGEVLGRERRALKSQIEAIQRGQQHPNLTEKLRNALGMLIDSPITSFFEGNPEKSGEYLELLDKGIDRLTEVRALQQGTTPPFPGELGKAAVQ